MFTGHVSAASGALINGGSSVVALVICSVDILGRQVQRERLSRSVIWFELAKRRHGLLASVATAALYSAPILVFGAVCSSGLPTFALVEKPFRQVFAGLSVFVDFLQGVFADVRSASKRRMVRHLTRWSLLLVLPVACVLGLAVWPWVTVLWRQVQPPVWGLPAVCVLTAAGLIDACLSRAFMPGLGLTAQVTQISIIVCGICVPAVGLAGSLLGPGGGILGFVVVLLLKIVLQQRTIRRSSLLSAISNSA
jgi:hypothetical protein